MPQSTQHEERVERAARRLNELVAQGMRYDRARTVLTGEQGGTAYWNRTLDEAEQMTRSRRRNAGARQRTEYWTQVRELARQQRERQRGQAIPERPRTVEYEPRDTRNTTLTPELYQVRFTNPFTGRIELLTIIIPTFGAMSRESIISRIAAAVSIEQRETGYEGKRRYYEAILAGTIEGPRTLPE